MPALKYWDAATSSWKIGAVGPPAGQVWQQIIGDGVATNFIVTHGFGTRAVSVSVYRNSPPYEEVEADIERTDTNSVTVRTSPTVPAVSEFIVAVASAGTQATLDITMDTWHVVGAAGEPAFGSNYQNYGGAYPTCGFRKDPMGRVWLKGLLANKVIPTTQEIVWTFPVGYRPPATQILYTSVNGTSGVRLDMNADGTLRFVTAEVAVTALSYIPLDGLNFDTESVLQTASVAAQPLDTLHFIGNPGEPAFVNSWVHFDSGSGTPGTGTSRNAGFRKYPDGRVRLFGTIKGGANSSVVFTLPVGYRPSRAASIIAVSANGGPAQITVNTDGTVTPTNMVASTSVTNWVWLDGVEFDTETVAAYASGIIGPPKVTVLPANPIDGQECYFVADATNGVIWHLRYNSGSASTYKWEFVGGTALASRTAITGTVTSLNPTLSVPTGSPSVVLPLAGDYDIEWASQGTYTLSQQYWYVVPVVGTTNITSLTAPYFGTAFAGQYGRNVGDGRASGRAAGDNIRLGFTIAAAGTLSPQDSTLRVQPVRVG